MQKNPDAELGIPELVFRSIVDEYDPEGRDRFFGRPESPHQYRCRRIQTTWGPVIILVHYQSDKEATVRSIDLCEVREDTVLLQTVARHERLCSLWFRQDLPDQVPHHGWLHNGNRYLAHPLYPLMNEIVQRARREFEKLGLAT